MATNEDQVPSAASVTLSVCGCPSIWLRLHRKDGSLLAVACMPVDTAIGVAEELTKCLLEAASRLATARCDAVH